VSGLDWSVTALYAAAMVAMSFWVGRGHASASDYFLASRSMPGWLVCSSILATQLSAISLVGGPAFVAMKPGGGLVWLQYELAVPLAMAALLLWIAPALHARGGITIYEFLEDRFGRGTRRALSLVFIASRSLATGVMLYATAVVLAVCLDWRVDATILAVGAITVLYTTAGGIRADIYTDAAQFVVLAVGTIVLLACAASLDGAFEAPPERLAVLDFGHTGLGDGRTFAFWPMLLGGFFLYVAYYGCDQSQAQRLLTTASEGETRKALLWNGLLRFPLSLLYILVGVALAGVMARPGPLVDAMAGQRADFLVPVFLRDHVPSGLRGLVVAGMLAAAMSSIDSAINSLSAATLRDLPAQPVGDDARGLRLGRIWSVLWGVAATAAALGAQHSSETVIELVNKIGSAFYGPVLGVFVMAIFVARVRAAGAMAGLAAGLAVNVALWRLAPGVSWLWWNVTGFAACVAVGAAVGGAPRIGPRAAPPPGAVRQAAVLGGTFAAMLAALLVWTMVR